MKYYATKVGINDISGDAEIIEQVEIGTPLVNYWEHSVVTDTSGNAYYSYAGVFGKINVDSPYTKTEITLSDCGYATQEIYGMMVDRDSEYLYLVIYGAVGVSAQYLLKIPLDDFTYGNTTLVKDFGTKAYTRQSQIDKFGNVWFDAFSGSYGVNMLEKSTNNIIAGGVTFGSVIVLDQHGVAWSFGSETSGGRYRHFYDSALHTVTTSNPVGITNKLQIKDGVCDKNNYVCLLYNIGTDTTTACKIIRIDVSDINNPVDLDEIILTYGGSNLTDCYNLHTNYAGDYFFSTYGAIDGYNTYKVDGSTKAITLFLVGVGSKTFGNDPYGFLLTDKGCTGASVS